MTQRALIQRLEDHVRQLAEEIGERNLFRPQMLHAAETYVRDAFVAADYEVTAYPYSIHGIRSASLEVTCEGSDRREKIVLIGAHYDSVRGSPGADDNASAVAALLELARLFRSRRPRYSVRFVAFTNEEPPFFFTRKQGSRVYAREARRRGDDIRVMLSLEMLGYYRAAPGSQSYPPLVRFFYPDRGEFIALVSIFRSRAVRCSRLSRARLTRAILSACLKATSLAPEKSVGWKTCVTRGLCRAPFIDRSCSAARARRSAR